MLVVVAVYLGVHCIMAKKAGALRISRPRWLANGYVILFAVIFLLGLDFWAWGLNRPIWLGLPWWAAYFAALSALQTFVMYMMIRNEYRR